MCCILLVYSSSRHLWCCSRYHKTSGLSLEWGFCFAPVFELLSHFILRRFWLGPAIHFLTLRLTWHDRNGVMCMCVMEGENQGKCLCQQEYVCHTCKVAACFFHSFTVIKKTTKCYFVDLVVELPSTQSPSVPLSLSHKNITSD